MRDSIAKLLRRGTRRLSGNGLRWVGALASAALLAGISFAVARGFPLVELPKGSIAPYTIRATHDAVFDLHETFRAEAEETRQTYHPIYLRDDGLPFDRLDKILRAALAEPTPVWRYAAAEPPESVSDGEAEDVAPSAPRDSGTAGPGDAGGPDGGEPAVAEGTTRERRREIESLVRGCFGILETYYRDGVVGDNEFPKEKKNVRELANGVYTPKLVADLHPFSALRPALEKSAAQYFFKTRAQVREQVINYILQRLPPNLTYSKENEKFVTDISQVTGVKMVLIRSGEILARRGEVVNTRAYYAIQASVAAASDTSVRGIRAGKIFLLLCVMLLFVVATGEICPGPFRSFRSHMVVHAGVLLLVASGEILLLYFPLHPAVVPQAALPLLVAVVMGRAPGLLAALLAPACFLLTQIFELSTLLVGVAGGVTAALAVRRRRRGSALAAGVVVGVAQAVVFEAARTLEGRPRNYFELWSAGEAFLGGLLSGVFAVLALPFVERFLGKSSRGKLRVLTDFDHPLVRDLRERAPGTFAHTVTLMSMVEAAVEAVGGEKLLARVGTLFHDVGKIVGPLQFAENRIPGGPVLPALSPENRALAVVAHVADGLVLAKKHHLPRDVTAFIAEHHGTTELMELLAEARAAGVEPDLDLYRYPGPKPQSEETAILMIADAVETAARGLHQPEEEVLDDLVDAVIFKALAGFQFDECRINQGDLKRIKEALVSCLVRKLRRQARTPLEPGG